MKKKARSCQLAVVTLAWLCFLRSAALADVVWPEGEEPNIFVQWWLNRATRNAAFWPAIITICVVTVGLVLFFIRLRQYKRTRNQLGT